MLIIAMPTRPDVARSVDDGAESSDGRGDDKAQGCKNQDGKLCIAWHFFTNLRHQAFLDHSLHAWPLRSSVTVAIYAVR